MVLTRVIQLRGQSSARPSREDFIWISEDEFSRSRFIRVEAFADNVLVLDCVDTTRRIHDFLHPRNCPLSGRRIVSLLIGVSIN